MFYNKWGTIMTIKEKISYYLMLYDYKRLSKKGKRMIDALRMSPQDYKNTCERVQ